jgi:hypothetical protein
LKKNALKIATSTKNVRLIIQKVNQFLLKLLCEPANAEANVNSMDQEPTQITRMPNRVLITANHMYNLKPNLINLFGFKGSLVEEKLSQVVKRRFNEQVQNHRTHNDAGELFKVVLQAKKTLL